MSELLLPWIKSLDTAWNRAHSVRGPGEAPRYLPRRALEIDERVHFKKALVFLRSEIATNLLPSLNQVIEDRLLIRALTHVSWRNYGHAVNVFLFRAKSYQGTTGGQRNFDPIKRNS